jgi:hypothetical protein
MDVLKMLAELRQDGARIGEAIVALEKLVRGPAKRRGRPQSSAASGPKRRGRPPGSKNKPKHEAAKPG